MTQVSNKLIPYLMAWTWSNTKSGRHRLPDFTRQLDGLFAARHWSLALLQGMRGMTAKSVGSGGELSKLTIGMKPVMRLRINVTGDPACTVSSSLMAVLTSHTHSEAPRLVRNLSVPPVRFYCLSGRQLPSTQLCHSTSLIFTPILQPS